MKYSNSAYLPSSAFWTFLLTSAAATVETTNGYIRTRPVARFLQNQTCTEACCQQYMAGCTTGSSSTNIFTNVPLGVQIILILALISMSAMFSGLTLGLMSLDVTGLEIVMDGDDPKNADYARM